MPVMTADTALRVAQKTAKAYSQPATSTLPDPWEYTHTIEVVI